MKANNRPCPVCSSEKKTVLAPIEFTLFDGHPMNGGYDLVQCDNCGFVFADTYVTQAQLDVYYTELSKYEDKVVSTGGGYNQNDRDRLRAAAMVIAERVENKEARILDLGCANGGFLRELRDIGFTNLVGVDPSSVCVDVAMAEVGCEVRQSSLFSMPPDIGKFDVIILSHVLEHVLDVNLALNIIDDLLQDGGCLYLECPNAEYYYKIIHAPLQEFNSEHINHFSKASFRNLMRLRGYEEIVLGDKIFKIASNQDYHAVYGVFKKDVNSVAHTVHYDDSIRTSISKYLVESGRMLSQIFEQLDAVPGDSGIALYGVGQLSFKLLSAPSMKDRHTIKLFDNSTINVGKTIRGVRILHGDQLIDEYKKEKFVVFISSLIHETAIRNNIMRKFSNETELPQLIGFGNVLSD